MKNEEFIDDENLKEEAPVLFGIKKQEPFLAPDGYLENFRVKLPENKKNQITWLELILKPVYWVPSLAIVLVVCVFLFRGENDVEVNVTAKTKIENIDLNSISYDVLDAYVHDHLLAQVNSDELMEIVGEKNIPSLGIASENVAQQENEAPAIENVDEEEMEEYIMENIDEMEIL